MTRPGSTRRQRRLQQLARWFETFWWCDCRYRNVATYRCYGCGSRPPRDVRALVSKAEPPEG